MITAIVITILALTLIYMPLPIRMNGDIDVFQNDGWFKVYVLGVRVVKTEAYFSHIDAVHNNLVLHSKRKDYVWHVNADKNDKKSIIQLFNIDFLPYINVVSVDLNLQLGKRDDALFTALVTSGARVVACSIFAALKSAQHVEIYEHFVPVYNKDELRIVFEGIINVSVADIIFSFILYLRRKSREKQDNYQSGGQKIDNRAQ